jgi:hypothetical protein
MQPRRSLAAEKNILHIVGAKLGSPSVEAVDDPHCRSIITGLEVQHQQIVFGQVGSEAGLVRLSYTTHQRGKVALFPIKHKDIGDALTRRKHSHRQSLVIGR